jgi:hypothetical protein
MEAEVAPLLSVFNTNSLEGGSGKHTDLFLNPVDDYRSIILDRFDTFDQARFRLIDLVTAVTWHFQRLDRELRYRHSSDVRIPTVFKDPRKGLDQWSVNFDDFVQRQECCWTNKERKVATVIRVLRLSVEFGIKSLQTKCECDWDAYYTEYEEIIRLVNALVSDPDCFPNEVLRTVTLDFGLLFPMHAVAYKCRWSYLRRKGLDLLRRMPKREWLFFSQHYHKIFSRIMEIEEAYLNLP